GLNMARKAPGQPIPTPAVMHLGAGHYTALLDQTNGCYLLEDIALSFRGWVPLAALEAQASGYFLIPAGPLPLGFEPVSERVASGVFGRYDEQKLAFSPSLRECDPTAGGDGDQCNAMPRYTFHQELAALLVRDMPVGYQPPVGPGVFARIAYNDLDDSKPVGNPTFPN